MQDDINQYYNNLAAEYDKDRFENSYGQYIDFQEKKIIKRLLRSNHKDKTLDLACGTGRFLEFAHYGLDASPNMLAEAKTKHPKAELLQGNALETHFEENSFETILSFHFIMHLDKGKTKQFLDEAHRLLLPDGKLIFDFPSQNRRKLINYKAKNWHAANDLTIEDIKELASDQWEIKAYYGILFFPIHRLPSKVRKLFRIADTMLCRSFFKKYASYIIVVLEKK